MTNAFQQRRCLEQNPELLRRVENLATSSGGQDDSSEVPGAPLNEALADAVCEVAESGAAASNFAGFAGQYSGASAITSMADGNFAVSAGAPLAQIRITCADEADADWPDPAPIGAGLPPVEKFDLEFLPAAFRPMVSDISERMQAPADFAAAATVVSLAGCVNRRAVIFPKEQDHSWKVVPNLWGAMVGAPGVMKSPILQAVTQPLTIIESLWRALYEQEVEEFAGEAEKAKLRHDAWTQEYKRACKKNQPPPVAPDTSLRTPTRKRLLLTDITYEKLHEILNENPAGVFVIRDELTGWLADLDRPGREGERGFFLQAWNGDSFFDVDRIGRGSIHVPAACVSLFGLIQPARLRSYLADALAGGPTDDGLFQRFQILVWPDTEAEWHLIDRKPDVAAQEKVTRVFSVLAELSSDSPTQLHFSPDAQTLFYEWLGELEHKIRGETELHPAAVSHLAKYRSLLPTLAGLFELADSAAEGIDHISTLISVDHARQAAAYCAYLESHAHRVYACLVTPELNLARELAQHLEAGHLPAVFTTRDIYNKNWRGLDKPESARAALHLLEEFDWVRRIGEPETAGKRGRPSERWETNPKVVRG